MVRGRRRDATGADYRAARRSRVPERHADLLLDRRRRITAGDRVLPRGELDAASALATLDKTRAKLLHLVLAHDGLSLGAVSHPHPAFGMLDGYQWFAFIGTHEARHAAQIREIGEALVTRSRD